MASEYLIGRPRGSVNADTRDPDKQDADDHQVVAGTTFDRPRPSIGAATLADAWRQHRDSLEYFAGAADINDHAGVRTLLGELSDNARECMGQIEQVFEAEFPGMSLESLSRTA